jgi:hypothetical protein
MKKLTLAFYAALIVCAGVAYAWAQGFSGVPSANQIFVGPPSGSPAAASFRSPTSWFDSAYCNTVGWVIARTTSAWTCANGVPANVEWFGVLTSNSGTTNQSNLQTLANNLATAGGGQLYVPGNGYSITGIITLTNRVGITCTYRGDPTVSANLIETTLSSDLIHVHTGYNLIDNCSFAMAGNPSGAATGIKYGDDAVQITTGNSFSSGSATLTCTSCTFTPADVDKTVYAVGAGTSSGPLFTSILTYTDANHVQMAATAGTNQTNTTFGYGFDYQENVIRDSAIYNFVTEINVIAATQEHIDHVYMLGTDPLILQNILWSDQGDGEVTRNTIVAAFAGSHNTVLITSGGGLRFQNNKVLAQAAISNCIDVEWTGVSSVGPWMIGNSIEGPCSSGIAVNGTAAGAAYGGMIEGNEIGIASGGTSINANPTNAHPNWTILGNLLRTTGVGTAATITNMTNVTVGPDTIENIDASSGGIGYSFGSTSSGVFRSGANGETYTYQNSSANMVIDDPLGLSFANLPSSAANGSRIFVTNGAPASSACTGSSSGSTAFRQNGAWKCF